MKTIERIVALLEEKDIVPAKMMKELGFSNGLFSQWKSGLQNPSAEKVFKIADYLGCSTDYLLGRTDNPNITSETYNNGDNGIQNVKNGTVNINQSDEMTKEISLLLSDLTYRQKTDLMKQIYDFVDETKKEGE